MLFEELASVSDAVRAAAARGDKVALLAGALRRLDRDEVAAGTAFLAGDLLQRQVGVGWAAMRDAPPPAGEAVLTVADVDAALARIAAAAGPGSMALRRSELGSLLSRATAPEQRLLFGLLAGDLRQGALAGVMTEAIARAAETPPADVRRALMLRGDLPAVAAIALREGAAGLRAVRLEVGRPMLPMLAGTASGVEDALERIRPAAVEWKLDGARIQVHARAGDVAVFTRSLDDVTQRVPEIVAFARGLPATAFVLDGEAIALRDDGSPHPFQVTASRFGSRNRTSEVPLTALFFDLLHLDGDDLLDLPGASRWSALERLVPEASRVPRVVAEDAAAAERHLDAALARGHEGVVVKSLTVPYAAGRRGAGWLKVKPVHTLDLVVLAAEWGHGRRRGWLSNLHLGARDPEGSGFVMLGKTFKGLTDEMLRAQTEHLLSLAIEQDRHVVRVRPELVVEVAFDGVQTSPRYPGGVALRFARVMRHRFDKPATEADTIDAVLAHHRR